MGIRTAAHSLAKRTAFSSAINILPNEVSSTEILSDNDFARARPYTEIPGPKELPLIGNSWRFAPIIGKLSLKVNPIPTTICHNQSNALNRF